jgi:hypothetical protein
MDLNLDLNLDLVREIDLNINLNLIMGLILLSLYLIGPDLFMDLDLGSMQFSGNRKKIFHRFFCALLISSSNFRRISTALDLNLELKLGLNLDLDLGLDVDLDVGIDLCWTGYGSVPGSILTYLFLVSIS